MFRVGLGGAQVTTKDLSQGGLLPAAVARSRKGQRAAQQGALVAIPDEPSHVLRKRTHGYICNLLGCYALGNKALQPFFCRTYGIAINDVKPSTFVILRLWEIPYFTSGYVFGR